MKDNFYKSVTVGAILALLGISIMAYCVFIIKEEGHPNESNNTIQAIHRDTTQRNILQKETNKLLGDVVRILQEPQLIECAD